MLKNSLIASLLSLSTRFGGIEDVRSWIWKRNRDVVVDVQLVPFKEMRDWHVEPDGSICHDSGKFFSIQGIHVETDYGAVSSWEQPIINQPEIGYLGILAKEFDGVLYFLMQAKIEPGNVNCVQISPTLQATKSNYTQVHGGKKVAYLDFFKNAKPEQIILDQLQSEQGARFLRKRNRNIIIKVDEVVPVAEDFCWMTLGQIKALMQEDNRVNMDTRTVISGIDFAGMIEKGASLSQMSEFGKMMMESSSRKVGECSMREILSWLTSLKAQYDLNVTRIPLRKAEGWECREDEIVRSDGKYFRVLGTRVSIDNREVKSWCQPLVQPMQQGLCAFIVRKINGICHFLVQAKLECGNIDVFEMAPSVQCLTGNMFEATVKPPYADYVLNARKEQIVYDTLQSEEGGRFYHEQNRNMIVIADDDFPLELPATYHWLTLGQINEFLRYNNYLNIQARSLIAAIQYK